MKLLKYQLYSFCLTHCVLSEREDRRTHPSPAWRHGTMPSRARTQCIRTSESFRSQSFRVSVERGARDSTTEWADTLRRRLAQHGAHTALISPHTVRHPAWHELQASRAPRIPPLVHGAVFTRADRLVTSQCTPARRGREAPLVAASAARHT